MIEIVQNGHKVLRQIAHEVLISDIKKSKIKKIISDMGKALHSQDDGVAIAAPQIACNLRIFVVSGKIFDENFIRGKENKSITKQMHQDLIFINPEIKKISRDRKLMDEGCLSVRPIYGKVRRATRVSIVAYNENGERVEKNASGLLAHIFQHEIDHLDGILFIDKAKDLHESNGEEEFK